MRHIGLKARMAIVGSILFGIYAATVGIAMAAFDVGLPIVLLGSILFVGVQYKIGKWGALRSVGAEDLSEDRYSEIHRRVESLSDDMGIEKPRLMIAQMGAPNAFAVGRKSAATVVISEELLQALEIDELESVLAHELAHIRNRDVVMMVLGQGVASIAAIIVQWIILLAGDNEIVDYILSIFVAQLVQGLVMLFVLAISRYREYVADSDAAGQTSGESLARALEKIRRGNAARGDQDSDSELDSQVSALCIFGEEKGLARLFATHPPIEKRINRLRSQ